MLNHLIEATLRGYLRRILPPGWRATVACDLPSHDPLDSDSHVNPRARTIEVHLARRIDSQYLPFLKRWLLSELVDAKVIRP